MKKLITILGAGLLAFGMFTSCGAKDVNLSWSEERTSYDYIYEVTAGSISKIADATVYTTATPASTTSYDFAFRYAEISWTEGKSNYQGEAADGNKANYTLRLVYDKVTTVTNNTTNLITSKSDPTEVDESFTISKIGDKYYINAGSDNQAEVTIDGDIEDDEFTFSVDLFNVSYPNDWNADGSTKYIQGTTVPVVKSVKNGASLSNITIVRK